MFESSITPDGSNNAPQIRGPLAGITIIMRRSASEELHRLFEGTVVEVFQNELGIIQPGLVEYITDILDRNVSAEQLYRLGDRRLGDCRLGDQAALTKDNRTYSLPNQLGLMLRCCNELELDIAPSRQLLADMYSSVGDYVLFFSGIYPAAHIEPVLNLYATHIPREVSTISELGESAYRRAVEILEQKSLYELPSLSEQKDQTRINAVGYLSDNFKTCVNGMRSARDHLFHLIGERMHRGILLGS